MQEFWNHLGRLWRWEPLRRRRDEDVICFDVTVKEDVPGFFFFLFWKLKGLLVLSSDFFFKPVTFSLLKVIKSVNDLVWKQDGKYSYLFFFSLSCGSEAGPRRAESSLLRLYLPLQNLPVSARVGRQQAYCFNKMTRCTTEDFCLRSDYYLII